jgi:hypothetical protein
MTESDIRLVLQAALQALVGLQLSIAHDAASMKVFHFGDIRLHTSGKGTVGAYALHIQCPWRIVSYEGVVTGASDRFAPPCEGADVDDEDARSGNLQLVRIAALLKGYDTSTKSHVNSTDELVVTSVTSDKYGGAELLLSGGYRLQIFPDSSQEEDWRFIDLEGRHVVIEKGQASIME